MELLFIANVDNWIKLDSIGVIYLVARSVKTVSTNILAINCKFHKFATIRLHMMCKFVIMCICFRSTAIYFYEILGQLGILLSCPCDYRSHILIIIMEVYMHDMINVDVIILFPFILTQFIFSYIFVCSTLLLC